MLLFTKDSDVGKVVELADFSVRPIEGQNILLAFDIFFVPGIMDQKKNSTMQHNLSRKSVILIYV